MFMIAAFLFAQSGCAMLIGHVAFAAGKKVYHEIKEDKEQKERDKQESQSREQRANR
jgi:dipeptide/tripeptide permease